jgi:hypothetical protein
VDDEMVYTSEARGLYGSTDLEPDEAAEEIARDFLVFCKLAALRGAVPRGWDWAAVLDAAPRHLPYAFEKSDAQTKYKGENVFAAMTGGRSLRYTGEVVYGSPCNSYDASDEYGEMYDAVDEARPRLHNDVGGEDAWMQLTDDLQYELERSRGGAFYGTAEATFDGQPAGKKKRGKKKGGGRAPGR